MDDFIILNSNKRSLASIQLLIGDFLQEKLLLSFHTKKTFIQPAWKGVDFLGYVLFEENIRLRKSTIGRFTQRMKAYQSKFRKGLVSQEKIQASIISWIAYAKHAKSWRLREKLTKSEK